MEICVVSKVKGVYLRALYILMNLVAMVMNEMGVDCWSFFLLLLYTVTTWALFKLPIIMSSMIRLNTLRSINSSSLSFITSFRALYNFILSPPMISLLTLFWRPQAKSQIEGPLTTNEVEDYYKIIEGFMDFDTMSAKLHEGMYCWKQISNFNLILNGWQPAFSLHWLTKYYWTSGRWELNSPPLSNNLINRFTFAYTLVSIDTINHFLLCFNSCIHNDIPSKKLAVEENRRGKFCWTPITVDYFEKRWFSINFFLKYYDMWDYINRGTDSLKTK